MIPRPCIQDIEFSPSPLKLPPASVPLEVRVRMQDGSSSSFIAASCEQPAQWLRQGAGFFFSTPILFVSRLEPEAVKEAAQAMARDKSGYWLRYYNSSVRAFHNDRSPHPPSGSAAAIDKVELADVQPSGSPKHCSAVAQVKLQDSRQFSFLLATPSSFEEALMALGLRYYFGHQVLFLRSIGPALARRAAAEMGKEGERWLCLYDTPRTTLQKVLSDFKTRH